MFNWCCHRTISSFTGSPRPLLLSDGVMLTGAHSCLFNPTFSITQASAPTRHVLHFNKDKTLWSTGSNNPALFRDGWVTQGSLEPQNTSGRHFVAVNQAVCVIWQAVRVLLGRLNKQMRWEVLEHRALKARTISHRMRGPTAGCRDPRWIVLHDGSCKTVRPRRGAVEKNTFEET